MMTDRGSISTQAILNSLNNKTLGKFMSQSQEHTQKNSEKSRRCEFMAESEKCCAMVKSSCGNDIVLYNKE